MTDTEEKDEVFNPDMKTEIVHGIGYSLLSLLGMIISIAGIVFAIFNRFLGPAIWVVGAALVVFTMVKNVQAKHGKGFRVANLVIKGMLLAFSTILILLVTFAPR